MTTDERRKRDRDAARRLLAHYVKSMVDCWGRAGLHAASAERFTAIGSTGGQRTRRPRNRLHEHVRILYTAGEVATLAWADGTRELLPVPRRRRAWAPTVAATIRTDRETVLTFRIPEAEADELAAIEAPPERPRDSPEECSGGT